jgi:hypothetical protein
MKYAKVKMPPLLRVCADVLMILAVPLVIFGAGMVVFASETESIFAKQFGLSVETQCATTGGDGEGGAGCAPAPSMAAQSRETASRSLLFGGVVLAIGSSVVRWRMHQLEATQE